MIMASLTIIKRRICITIKRFKFEELESAVMPIFPEISWTQVRSKLIKSYKTFNVNNASHVIEEALDNANLRERELYDRLITLEVIDISRHSKRRIWYGYELTGSHKIKSYLVKQEIEGRIKEEFHTISLDMNVKVVTYDNVTFICIKETKKKKQLQNTMPIFFALFLGHKYFFCSQKNVPLDFIKVIATNVGYKNGKRISLMGKDLKSLIRLLWVKQQGVLHVEDIDQPPVYKPSNPSIKNNGIDYTQANQRKIYSEQCFGKDPPTLELLVIKGPEQSIQHDDLASILSTDTIHMNWEFRSRNIGRFLINLIEKRVFTLPLPDYVPNLLKLGKNELTLRTD